MKKSELNQIIQLIEIVVKKEITKQFTTLISEAVKKEINKVNNTAPLNTGTTFLNEGIIDEEVDSEPTKVNLKSSLRELFSGTPVMEPPISNTQPRTFSKNPLINKILNETKSDLRAREGLVGMAAFQGGYSPSVSAAPMMPMEESNEPSFMRGVPALDGHINNGSRQKIPVGTPPVLMEGQESTHAPLSNIPVGVSVLDMAKHGAVPDTVTI